MIPPFIANNPDHRTLTLTWEDGQQQDFNHGKLRAACLCAFCRARRLQGESIDIEPLRYITAIHAHGYGLQIIFDDGHDRGIYPWPYLQGMV